jgi:hypothetical protein
MKTTYALIVGTVATMGLTGLTGAASTGPAETVESLTLRLYLHNHAQISRAVVIRAEKEVTRIYRGFGVTTVWVDGESAPPAGRDLELIVIINSKMAEQRPSVSEVMGRAPGSRVQQGRIAFAYYEPVERFARAYDVDVAVVLGYVMAHEIGHLLLPFGTHSKTGVMRGHWDTPQVRNAVLGQLQFTAEQAALIRLKLRATASVS